MTPGYPVLGQGSLIQENWFQNWTQRPRFAMKGHPTRYGFGKKENFFFLICIISLSSALLALYWLTIEIFANSASYSSLATPKTQSSKVLLESTDLSKSYGRKAPQLGN